MTSRTIGRLSQLCLLLLLGGAGCQAPRSNAPPEAAILAPDKPAYFLCDKCGSLDGGSYADRQTKQLRTAEGEACVHQWFPISRNEFRELGTERFGIDWKLEGPTWQGAQPELQGAETHGPESQGPEPQGPGPTGSAAEGAERTPHLSPQPAQDNLTGAN